MSRVYVPQIPHRWDKVEEELVPKFDLSAAQEYGDLIELLTPEANPFGNMDSLNQELHEKLRHCTQEDYILLIGNPCLIGCVTAIAVNYTDGRIGMLQWHGIKRSYQPLFVDLRKGD